MDDALQDEALVLQRRLARMQALLEATRQVHSTIELEGVLRTALKTIAKELEVPGTLLLPGESISDIMPMAYGRPAQDALGQPEVLTGATWLELAGRDGKELARIGVLPRAAGAFEVDEVDFLEGLRLQAAIAIENARYHEDRVRLARISRDLETARSIQQSLIPSEMPKVRGYAVAAQSFPCYEVGGDYLDILTEEDGSCLMVVADVAGKGLSSALVGSAFRASLRAMSRTGVSLRDMASRLNQLHYAEGEETRMKYVTAFLARLYPGSQTLEVVNAGHPPGLLAVPGQETVRIKSTGMPLGLLPGVAYQSHMLEFPKEGVLLVYSDGLTEACRQGEEFGEERLLAALGDLRRHEPAAVLDEIWARLTAFEDGSESSDDKTALVIRRNA